MRRQRRRRRRCCAQPRERSPRHEGARPLNAVEEDDGEALAARLCYQFHLALHAVVLLFVARRRLYEQHLRLAHDEEFAGRLYVMVFCKDGAFAGHNGWSFNGLAKLMFFVGYMAAFDG